jgi:hypothetical protein
MSVDTLVVATMPPNEAVAGLQVIARRVDPDWDEWAAQFLAEQSAAPYGWNTHPSSTPELAAAPCPSPPAAMGASSLRQTDRTRRTGARDEHFSAIRQ